MLNEGLATFEEACYQLRVLLGLLPEAMERELMMGMKMPPALAVVEGIAGASRVSAALRP